MADQQAAKQFIWTWKRTTQALCAAILLPVLLCGLSGNWLRWQAWFVVLVQLLLYGMAALHICEHNPGLLHERETIIRNEGVAEFDKVLATAAVGLTYAMYLAAGLQPHLRSSPDVTVPFLATAAAATMETAAVSLQCWAMCSNRWFSSVVRLQSNRRHQVCSKGPYAVVRHPAYIAWVVQAFTEGLLLQSSWYLFLGGLRTAVVFARTMAEDAWLHHNLPGYQAYAARVHYRWLPYLW